MNTMKGNHELDHPTPDGADRKRHHRRRLLAPIPLLAMASFAAVGGLSSAVPARAAEACPTTATAPVAKWQTVYSHKAVTVCRGFDIAGAHVGDVQVVDFEAGGKMRVMSEPEPGQEIGTSDTRFDRKTGLGWFWWAQANVTSPAAAQLFSATSGSPFSLDATGRATMKFPQKKWNTLMSSGSERACHNMPELGVTGKRYFGLSDPRLPGRQTPYIDQYEDPCQSAPATATAALSGYHGRPVSLFDATVAFHPQYETSTGQGRRAFIGTRSMDGMWEGTQDRAYVFTSSSIWPGYLTVGQARALLVNDFHTMYNLQLDGASSGYHSILDGASAQDASNDESGVRGVPEVLLIYNAP